MRSLGLNKMPMVVGLMAMLANACFNYVFIFGWDRCRPWAWWARPWGR